MRYQQVLLPCEATARSAFGKVVAEANSILELWENLSRNLDFSQLWEIRDTKTQKSLSKEEFQAIVNRLKGWE